jgi:hypothetical protein
MVVKKVLSAIDAFAVEFQPATVCGVLLTLAAIVGVKKCFRPKRRFRFRFSKKKFQPLLFPGVVVYMIFMILSWSSSPLAIEVSLASHSLKPSLLNLKCTSVCGCAVSFLFSSGACVKMEGFTLQVNENKTVPICFSAKWDEGVVVTGAVSLSQIGQSIVSFEPDSRVRVDSAPVFTALPSTTLVGDPAALGARRLSTVRSQVITFRQTDIRDLTVAPDNLTTVYAIAFVNDGSNCPTKAPVCNQIEAVDFANKGDIERIGDYSGLSDEAIDSALRTLGLSGVTPPVPVPTITTPGGVPLPLPTRKRAVVTPTALNTLSSCYLLQKDQFVVDYALKSSFTYARVIGEFGGAHGAAFMLAGWIAMCASWAGLRKGKKSAEVEMKSAMNAVDE